MNLSDSVDAHVAALNLTEGEAVEWTVPVRDDLLDYNPLLNYSFVEQRLDGVAEVSGSAPRWWLLGNVTAGLSEYAASTIVMAIDSELELEAGIGRAWKDVPTLQGNEAYIMDTITRAMNLTQSDEYAEAVGSDFIMFSNLGGLQDAFGVDYASIFLDTEGGVQMEETLIARGIAMSCISVMIEANARPHDFSWILYEIPSDFDYDAVGQWVWNKNQSHIVAEGTVYSHRNSCINATATEYVFRIEDAFGNGLTGFEAGNFTVLWDNEIALTTSSVNGAFRFGSYEEAVITRPEGAYGKSIIVLNTTQQEQLEHYLNVVLDPQISTAIFNSMIVGMGLDPETTHQVMEQMLPHYNVSMMVDALQYSTYNESVEMVMGWIVYYIGFGGQLEVARSVESGAGKWAHLLGSVTVIDAKELSDLLFVSSEQIESAMDELINAAVGMGYITSLETIERFQVAEYYLSEIVSSDLYDYAIQIIIMYSDRLDAYMGTMLNLETHMVMFSNAVFDALGIEFQARVDLPIYDQLYYLIFFKLMLNEMLFLCIVLMSTLVLIVIYSLLLNDVEERTYTYGMLRALGMKKVTLIQIMLLKSITFSIPGTFVAMVFVQMANIPLIGLVEDFAHLSLSHSLPSVCFLNGMMIGFVVPLISIYVPTSRALSKTLRDSLDIYHHVESDVKVTMVRLEKLGFSVPIMGVSVILVVYGVVCSILVPISIYYQDKNVCFHPGDILTICFGSGYDLFFGIFGSILLTMLYGMCIIASLIAMPIASVLVRMALCSSRCSHHILREVVLKNLSSHSSRNVKTAIMFVTTLSFCIFAGVSNSFMTNNAVNFFWWLVGSDFEIWAYFISFNLPMDSLAPWLDLQKERGKIQDWSAQTFPLSWYVADEMSIIDSTISSLAGTPILGQWVVGVEENMLNVAEDKFLDIFEIGAYHNGSIPRLENDANYDVVKVLYTDAGRATLDWESNGIEIPPLITHGRYWTYENQSESMRQYYEQQNALFDELDATLNDSYTEYIDVLVATALVDAMGIDINDPLVLTLQVQDANHWVHTFQYMMKIRAILNKAPGLVMLPYDLQYASFLAEYQNAVISMDAHDAILEDIAERLGIKVPSTLWQRVAIRMPRDASDNDYDDVNEGIRNFVPDQQISVSDMHGVTKDVRENISLVNDFFILLGLIGMVLAFFILWLSFLANIRNSSWELGVLRSIGLNTFQVAMVYIYEALAIIFSCIILGTLIGTVTAVMLCTQSNLFLMMPLELDFPWTLYLSICGVAIFVALVGSYLPMRRYIHNNVAAVLRGK